MDITGRKLFVRALLEEGVDTIFGYPGGMNCISRKTFVWFCPAMSRH